MRRTRVVIMILMLIFHIDSRYTVTWVMSIAARGSVFFFKSVYLLAFIWTFWILALAFIRSHIALFITLHCQCGSIAVCFHEQIKASSKNNWDKKVLEKVKVYNLFAFGDPLEREKGRHGWYDGAIVAMMILMAMRNMMMMSTITWTWQAWHWDEQAERWFPWVQCSCTPLVVPFGKPDNFRILYYTHLSPLIQLAHF